MTRGKSGRWIFGITLKREVEGTSDIAGPVYYMKMTHDNQRETIDKMRK
jgi:hypothetical protein